MSPPAALPADVAQQPAVAPAQEKHSSANAAQAPADSSPSGTPAQPASAAAAPLEENGLIAQILAQIDRWNDGFEAELRQIMFAWHGFPVMLQRFAANLSNAAEQALLIKEFLALAAIFAVSLGLEGLLRRALRRPRRTLIEHAEHLELGMPAHAGRDDEAPSDQARAEAAGAMRPPVEGVALVRSQRDGIDRIDAVPVDAARSTGQPREAAPGPDSDGMHGLSRHAAPSRQWGRLQQLPLALGVLLIDLAPLVWFFFVSGISLHWLGQSEPAFRHMVHAVVVAYVGMRAAMAVLRLLVAPDGCGVPVVRVSRNIADLLYRWLRRMIVTAACGISLAGVAGALGAGMEARLAIMKAASLLVHLFAVMLILRIRRPVGALIAAPRHADGPLAAARGWLARSWATFAIVLVMGIWIVWALGVPDGFQKLLHFIGVTAGVIIAARILGILILGALGRIFHAGDRESAATAAPNGYARSERYYPLVQRLVTIAISVCTALALLQAWSLDVVGWLTQRPIGRSLLAAILTIAVAAIVGIAIWEVANAAVERRLEAWKAQGDKVRAARLRTLLPILRTCLFIVIALVVGLTALNEIGINTTPLLASASIVGVALGFGSQKLVQDFITGIFLLMENAMQVGDWVTVAGVSGTVEYLSIRTVRLRGGDGSLYTVPFSSVSTVNNTNRGLGNAVMRVSVSFGADIDLVTNELRQIGAGLRADPNFKDNILGDLEIWGVDAVDGSTVTLAGQIRCTDRGRWGVQRELNRRILERFRELGIQIADPRATVLLPREVSPPVVSAVQQPAPEKRAHADGPNRSCT